MKKCDFCQRYGACGGTYMTECIVHDYANFIQEDFNKGEMNMGKTDMSGTCDFKYREYWLDANYFHTMTPDKWKEWFNEHCGKCKYMCEVCMYGEE